MRKLFWTYQQACSRAISRYSSFVTKFMVNGVYAYFCYPTAHEDDAERAITARLGRIGAVIDLKLGLAVKIGAATSNVPEGNLIGERASEEANVVGKAPNLTARVQGLAGPNAIVICEATHMLAGDMLETAEFSAHDLKGISNHVGVWQVQQAITRESRFQATRRAYLTNFIGRKEKLATLIWPRQRTKTGEHRVVLIPANPASEDRGSLRCWRISFRNSRTA